MRTAFVLLFFFFAVTTCTAQIASVVVGKVQDDGHIEVTMAKWDIVDAIEIVKPIFAKPAEDGVYQLQIVLAFTAGKPPYLVCEVNDFVVAFECYRDGENVLIKPDGTTHLCTSEKCYNCAVSMTDSGEIIGCKCDDMGYDGTPRVSNHSIRTPQGDIITAILLKQQSRTR